FWKAQEVSRLGVARFCSYTWMTTQEALPDHSRLAQQPNTEIDCPVIAPLAPLQLLPVPIWAKLLPPSPADAWWKPLRDNYRVQAGRISNPPSAQSRVRVAVIDSAALPFWSQAVDRYGHGRAVGKVIADIACPTEGAAGCTTDVHNHLALPQVT